MMETAFLLATTGKFGAAINYIDLEPVGAGLPTIARAQACAAWSLARS